MDDLARWFSSRTGGRPPLGDGQGKSGAISGAKITGREGQGRYERFFKFSVTFRRLVTQRVGVEDPMG
jgi:hypothetical protein